MTIPLALGVLSMLQGVALALLASSLRSAARTQAHLVGRVSHLEARLDVLGLALAETRMDVAVQSETVAQRMDGLSKAIDAGLAAVAAQPETRRRGMALQDMPVAPQEH